MTNVWDVKWCQNEPQVEDDMASALSKMSQEPVFNQQSSEANYKLSLNMLISKLTWVLHLQA